VRAAFMLALIAERLTVPAAFRVRRELEMRDDLVAG
jgi:hypothetical protein